MKETITQELIEACRQGREEAFARLIAICRPYAYSVAFRMLCDEHDAKDAVQEAFIRIWKALDKYDGRAKFTTWFYAIVSRVCLDRLRARKRSAHVLSLDDRTEISDIITDDYRVDTELSNRDLAQIIASLTDGLPETQRLVFVLRDLEDLSIEEVCVVSGLSAGSVKTNLCYARRRIRAILIKQYKLTGDML
jgi:RNA polymerase sigma-70 factor, ECF subfamily